MYVASGQMVAAPSRLTSCQGVAPLGVPDSTCEPSPRSRNQEPTGTQNLQGSTWSLYSKDRANIR